jgi:hypothetical protein
VARRRARTPTFEQLLHALYSEPPGDLRPALEGFAYRFTIYLPLLSEGRAVFTDEHCDALADLFHERFEGYSATAVEGSPPWYGSWRPEGAPEPVIDRHMLFAIYTAQVEAARLFFRYLKSILQLPHVAHQEVVVIEQMPVWLVQGDLLPPLP